MRSTSSKSSVSVATISTNASISPRRSAHTEPQRDVDHQRSGPSELKRRRSSSGRSYSSDPDPRRPESRSTRRRISELSPHGRGRQRDRKLSLDNASHFSGGRSRSRESYAKERGNPSGRCRSRSGDRRDGMTEGNRTHDHDGGANGRRRRERRPRDRSVSSDRLKRHRYSDVDERYGATIRNNENAAPGRQQPTQSWVAPKERSLSPFSKRLALTQSINSGR
jgi:hypothetical protein